MLAEKELTVDKVLELCQAMEVTEKETKTVNVDDKDVHKVSRSYGNNSNSKWGVRNDSNSRWGGSHDSNSRWGGSHNSRGGRGERCHRCHGQHDPERCWHKKKKCNNCGRIGHLKIACQQPKQHGSRREKDTNSFKRKTHFVDNDVTVNNEDDDDDFSNYVSVSNECKLGINAVQGQNVKPFMIPMNVENKVTEMEIDTGASVSTISEKVYQKCYENVPLCKTECVLRAYSGETIPVLGEINVNVKHNEKMYKNMRLIVVKGNKPSLLGRDWLQEVKLNWENVFQLAGENKVNRLLNKYETVFTPSTDGIKNLRAHVTLKENGVCVFQKPRPVPYAMIDDVEAEYKRLIEAKILEPVSDSDWGTPVVCVQKPAGGVRVCGDYKRVNELVEDDCYKLPNVQDLLSKLAQGGNQPKVFTCLDLSGASNQLLLSEESSKFLVLNTHQGLMAPKRLTYGVKVAPAQFQAAIDKILAGIENVFCYIDDILIASNTPEQHYKTLEKVLARLQEYNVKLNRAKCKFLMEEVQYLGHRLTGEGVKPVQSKVDAIMKAPEPQDVSELRSF
jgi:hypothetical protein